MGRHSLSAVLVEPETDLSQVTVLSMPPVAEPARPVRERPGWRNAVRSACRHLPSELFATAIGLTAALAAQSVTGSPAAAAIAGTAGCCIGYFATIAAAGAWREARRPGGSPTQWTIRRVQATVSALGPAEVCDLFIVRPWLLYLVPTLLSVPLAVGFLFAKLIADVVYVVLTKPSENR